MKAKSYLPFAAICLVLSAFGLGLCLSLLSADTTIAFVSAALFITGSVPSFISLLLLTHQHRKYESD